METKYEYLIKLLQEYIEAPMDGECMVKVIRSTNRTSQAQMLLNDIKSGKLIESNK